MAHSTTSPVVPLERSATQPIPSFQHEVLLIAPDLAATEYAAVLRQTCRVVSTHNSDVAAQYLVKALPSLVVADADVVSDAASIIRTAKTLPASPTVLVIASDVERVPGLLEAGCDAVLLKPFAPNLLYARVGRLLRIRTEHGLRARLDQFRPRHTASNGGNGEDASQAGTNRRWADISCPNCRKQGAISFEYASHRRAWYACLECKSVWIDKRRE